MSYYYDDQEPDYEKNGSANALAKIGLKVMTLTAKRLMDILMPIGT